MKQLTNKARVDATRLFKLLCCSLLLCTCFTAAAAGWCYYVCGQNGVKNENYCNTANSETPCTGTCLRYIFTAPVTCYFCTTTLIGACNTPLAGQVFVPAAKYIAACGQDPYLLNCVCLEPYILSDPNSGFTCPTLATGSACFW